jgi:hypothetical protein
MPHRGAALPAHPLGAEREKLMTASQVNQFLGIGYLIAGAAVLGALAMILHLWLHWPRGD